MELLGGLSYVSYTIGAVVCGLAAIWIGRKGDSARADRTPAVVALALTANWCFAAASFVPGKPIVELTEIARNLSWLFLLFRLMTGVTRPCDWFVPLPPRSPSSKSCSSCCC